MVVLVDGEVFYIDDFMVFNFIDIVINEFISNLVLI